MARPAVAVTTDRMYGELVEELTAPDEQHGWALLHLLNAAARRLGPLDTLVSGEDGWGDLFDVDEVPAAFLPWLAQSVGVRLPQGISSSAARGRIRSPSRWRVATPAAVAAAVQEHLLGGRTVIIHERVDEVGGADEPYWFVVQVYAQQIATSQSAIEEAIEAVCPVELHFVVDPLAGQTHADASQKHATYADATAAYPTYQDGLEDIS